MIGEAIFVKIEGVFHKAGKKIGVKNSLVLCKTRVQNEAIK